MGQAARRGYSKSFAEPSAWMRTEGLREPHRPTNLEGLLLLLLLLLYAETASSMRPSQRTAPSWCRRRRTIGPISSRVYAFLRDRRALTGYLKQRPPRPRPPLPKEVLAGIVEMMVAWSR